jgi:hypothetical protein
MSGQDRDAVVGMMGIKRYRCQEGGRAGELEMDMQQNKLQRQMEDVVSSLNRINIYLIFRFVLLGIEPWQGKNIYFTGEKETNKNVHITLQKNITQTSFLQKDIYVALVFERSHINVCGCIL